MTVKIGLVDPENQFLEAKEWRNIWKQVRQLKISGPPTASTSNYDQSVQGSRTKGDFKSSVDLLGLTFLEIVSAQDLPPEKNGKSFFFTFLTLNSVFFNSLTLNLLF